MVALQTLGLAAEGRIIALVSAQAAGVDRGAIVRVLAKQEFVPIARLSNETTLFLAQQDPYVLFATASGNAAAVAIMALLQEAAKILAQIPVKNDAQCAYTLSAILDAILQDGQPATTEPSAVESWIDTENIDTQCFREPRISNLRQIQPAKKPEIYIDIIETYSYRFHFSGAPGTPDPTTSSRSSANVRSPTQAEVLGEIIVAAPGGNIPKSKVSWRYNTSAFPLAHECYNENVISSLRNDYVLTPPIYRTEICRYRHENLAAKDLPYDLSAEIKVNGTEIMMNFQIASQQDKHTFIASQKLDIEFTLPSDTEKVKVLKGRNFTHDKDRALGKWSLYQKSQGALVLQVKRYLPESELKTEILLHFSIDGLSLRKMEHLIPFESVGATDIVKWVKYISRSGHCSYRISSASNMAAAM